jgi:hypothetical protein
MTTAQLRAIGFTIYPVGRKVCFVDCRSGYTSPAYDPDTCESKLMQYISAHRVDTAQHGQSMMPL